MLQVAPYPLLLLLSISTHSLIQLLGGLTSAEISEELVLRLLKQLTEAQMLLPGDDPAQEQISLAKWFLHDSGAVAKASSGHRIRLTMAEEAVAEALDQDHHKLMWDKKRAAKEDFWCKPCLTPGDFERTINGDSRIMFRMVRARLVAVVPMHLLVLPTLSLQCCGLQTDPESRRLLLRSILSLNICTHDQETNIFRGQDSLRDMLYATSCADLLEISDRSQLEIGVTFTQFVLSENPDNVPLSTVPESLMQSLYCEDLIHWHRDDPVDWRCAPLSGGGLLLSDGCHIKGLTDEALVHLVSNATGPQKLESILTFAATVRQGRLQELFDPARVGLRDAFTRLWEHEKDLALQLPFSFVEILTEEPHNIARSELSSWLKKTTVDTTSHTHQQLFNQLVLFAMLHSEAKDEAEPEPGQTHSEPEPEARISAEDSAWADSIIDLLRATVAKDSKFNLPMHVSYSRSPQPYWAIMCKCKDLQGPPDWKSTLLEDKKALKVMTDTHCGRVLALVDDFVNADETARFVLETDSVDVGCLPLLKLLVWFRYPYLATKPPGANMEVIGTLVGGFGDEQQKPWFLAGERCAWTQEFSRLVRAGNCNNCRATNLSSLLTLHSSPPRPPPPPFPSRREIGLSQFLLNLSWTLLWQMRSRPASCSMANSCHANLSRVDSQSPGAR
jgi:hypothetical protein